MVLSIQVNGTRVKGTDEENCQNKMVHYTKVNEKMMHKMVKEDKFIAEENYKQQNGLFMKEILKITKPMGMVN